MAFLQRKTIYSPPSPPKPAVTEDPAIAESVNFWKAIGYPQYGGKYAPVAIPQNAKITQIDETPQGLNVAYRMMIDTGTESVPTRASALAEAYKQAYPSMMESKLQEEKAASDKRWERLGYPQFKDYQAPSIKEGDRIVRIVKTEKGLEIYTTKGESPSISEQLLTYETTPIAQRLGLPSTKPLEMFKRPQDVKTHPLSVIGGLLSPFESLTYSVANLLGIKTPSMPPSAFDLNVIMETPEYTLGNIYGNVALFIGGSYLAGKVVSGIAKGAELIGGKIEEQTGIAQKIRLSPIGEFIYGTKEKLPSLQPLKEPISDAEIWLAGKSETFKSYLGRGITEGIVDVPDIGFAASRTMSEKVLGLPEFQAPYQLLGMKPMEAEATAMSFADVPRTMILDPSLKTPLENPITREIFTTPKVFQNLPYAESLSQSVLPKLISGGAAVTLQLLPTRQSRSIAQPSRLSSVILSAPQLVLPSQEQRSKPKVASVVASAIGLSQGLKQSQGLSSVLGTTSLLKSQQIVRGIPSESYGGLYNYVFQVPRQQGRLGTSFQVGRGKTTRRGFGLQKYLYPVATARQAGRFAFRRTTSRKNHIANFNLGGYIYGNKRRKTRKR